MAHRSDRPSKISTTTGQRIIIGFIAVLLIVITAYDIKLINDTRQAQSHWQTFNTLDDIPARALSDLHAAIGYGGLIHNFNHFVIHKDPSSLQLSKHNHLQAKQAIKTYREAITNSRQQQALNRVESVLDEYAARLSAAELAFAQGQGTDQVSTLVRIDDGPALEALEDLAAISSQHREIIAAETQQSIDSVSRYTLLGALQVPILVVIGWIILTLIRQLTRSNDRLQHQQQEFADLFELNPDALIASDQHGNIVRVNRRTCDLTGYEREELLQLQVESLVPTETRDIHPTLRKGYLREQAQSRAMGQFRDLGLERKDGEEIAVEINLGRMGSGDHTFTLAVIRDITNRRLLDEKLRRVQKMEAVGQLTGGLAHDFNNILSIVMGNLELLEKRLQGDSESEKAIFNAMQGIRRGTEITRKLLSYTTEKASQTSIIDLNRFLEDFQHFLSSSLTSSIELKLNLAEDIGTVSINPGDMKDAILNLVLNAKDAMPGGGTLQISTGDATLDKSAAAKLVNGKAGEFVFVQVTDNGCGIPARQLDKIFEPFYSTKKFGNGSGLGLSMVYGFAQRSDGFSTVVSEPGKGSSFAIYLKKSEQAVPPAPAEQDVPAITLQDPGQQKTVLIVDDEEMLQDLAQKRFNSLGYNTITSGNARDALKILSSRKDIDLLFTDIIMPGQMDGYQLAQSALELNPKLKILLTSGYSLSENSDQALIEHASIASELEILHKPYKTPALVKALEKIFHAQPS